MLVCDAELNIHQLKICGPVLESLRIEYPMKGLPQKCARLPGVCSVPPSRKFHTVSHRVPKGMHARTGKAPKQRVIPQVNAASPEKRSQIKDMWFDEFLKSMHAASLLCLGAFLKLITGMDDI